MAYVSTCVFQCSKYVYSGKIRYIWPAVVDPFILKKKLLKTVKIDGDIILE